MNPVRILLVEDSPELAKAIEFKLKQKHAEVISAPSVTIALQKLKQSGTVDAIWMDHYLLGEESGIDLLKTLKAPRSKYRKIPVYLVSNTVTEDKIQDYLDHGIEEYLLKASNKIDDIAEKILTKVIGN